MTNSKRTEDIMRISIHFSKIGAKINESYKPLDIGLFKQILKQSGWNTTSAWSSSVTTGSVDRILKKLSMYKWFVIRQVELNALQDAVICVPKMTTSALTTRIIHIAFISSEILVEKMKLCSDTRGVIQSFKVNWKKLKVGWMYL